MRSTFRVLLIMAFVMGLGVLLVACVVGAGLYLWATNDAAGGLNPITAIELKVRLTRYRDTIESSAGTDISYREFVVQPGDTSTVIADNLLIAGLITDPNLFIDYVRYHGMDAELQAGTFFLQQTQTLEQIAYALTDASTASIPFRAIAGWRLDELAETGITGNTFLNFTGLEFLMLVNQSAVIPPDFAARNGIPPLMSNGAAPSLEGFMFPGDYKLQPNITPEELRDTLLAGFNTHVTDDMVIRAQVLGLSMYDVITLASIVQRETVVPEEASVIASVYLNRLNDNQRLDADPTVQYAIGFREGSWWPQLYGTTDYYAQSGPQPDYAYNTYLKQDGMSRADLLPPGPICSPGLAAINAVLYPAQTDYFYFRSCNDQTHIFSTNLTDHTNIQCP